MRFYSSCLFLLWISLACSSLDSISEENLKPENLNSSFFEKTPVDRRFSRILFAGDTHFAWRVREMQNKYGLAGPVEELEPLFKQADYRIINLETSFSKKSKPFARKSYIFNSEERNLELLRLLKINTAILGNNHSMDMGGIGLQETQRVLRKAGILSVGAGANHAQAASPLIFELHGVRYAILSYSNIGEQMIVSSAHRPGIVRARAGLVLKQIARLRRRVDIILVSLHWGIEYYTHPTPVQVREAHRMVDAGADIIIGHHPHVPQAFEIYKKSLIFYSIGNFLFGSVNERQEHNMVVRLNIDREKKRLVSGEIYPIFGRYREKSSDRIRQLTPDESRDFWRGMLVMTARLFPATARLIRVANDGSGEVILETSK